MRTELIRTNVQGERSEPVTVRNLEKAMALLSVHQVSGTRYMV